MGIFGGLTWLKMFQLAELNPLFLNHITNILIAVVITLFLSLITPMVGEVTKYLNVSSFIFYYVRLNFQDFRDVKLCWLGE
jgi:hypothetical protein